MTNVTQTELFPGVRLTAVHTTKFKSCMLGLRLLTPLAEQTASLHALIPQVLRRGTARHPDLESLSAALDDLYGGTVEPMVRKKGETQCLGFVGSFLDDAYTPAGEPILERAAALMGDLLLRPALENETFRAEYVDGERENLLNAIRAQVNDKRQYAQKRLIEEMCASEPFGVDKLGSEERAKSITVPRLWDQYQKLLREAWIELYYCGSAPLERVKTALTAALEGLPYSEKRIRPPKPDEPAAPAEPKVVEESLEVTQGKLTLGFRTGITAWDGDYPALALLNAIYGGTTTSKLFMNVREKLSLCYYASSGLMKYKGIMLVSSGVEFDKFQAARKEIMAQFLACREGKFDDQELAGARASVVSSLMTTLDSQSRLEDYWLGQTAAGLTEGPEDLARRVEDVTWEQVHAAAQKVSPDTIYFLKGKEA